MTAKSNTQAAEVAVIPRVWRNTLRKLAFMAGTSGGTAGPDQGLKDALKEAMDLLDGPYRYADAIQPTPEPASVESLRKDFARECVDTDTLLRLLGFEPNEVRTEGGSLNLRRLANLIEARKTAPEPVAQADGVPLAWQSTREGLLAYVLQDDLHNRLTPRVIDIAYTAFMSGASGKNKDDGGPCDWFNDTRPVVIEAIEKVRKDLSEAAAAPSPVALQGRDERKQVEDIARLHGTGGWQTLDDMVRFGLAVWQAARASLPAGGVVPFERIADVESDEIADMRPGRAYREGWNDCLKSMLDGRGEPMTAGGVVEPVAVIGDGWQFLWASRNADTIEDIVKRHGLKIGSKLYATPQPSETQGRRQMTDEQVIECAARHLGEMHVENCGLGDIKAFARAIEAHHGTPASPQDGGEKA